MVLGRRWTGGLLNGFLDDVVLIISWDRRLGGKVEWLLSAETGGEWVGGWYGGNQHGRLSGLEDNMVPAASSR